MRVVIFSILIILGLATSSLTAAEPPAGISNVQLEALQRLNGVDLETNPALKAAVLKIVETTRGTPQFVELVEQFKLTGQAAGLLEVALKFPTEELGVKAMRLVLDANEPALINAALTGSETNAVAGVQALGNTRLPLINDLVLPLLTAEGSSDRIRREVVKALAKNEPGARRLLALASEGKLVDEVKLTAATALSQVGSAEIRNAAERVLPLPKAGGDEALPPIAELAKRTGDPVKGKQVFFSEATACHRCHQVNGEGIAIGPDLSQIGDKLGKDALLEAILDPNNGIAFGFEAWTVTTKSDEEVYGLLASETGDELVVKDLSGILHRLKKPEIVTRTQSKFSLMPAGLQASMKVQELVDLVEYMRHLRKPAGH